MIESKKIWKSKTVWFNLIMAGLAALEASLSQMVGIIPATYYGIVATVLAIGNALLRVISTTKIEL